MRGKSWRGGGGRRSEKGWREVDGEEVERKVRWSLDLPQFCVSRKKG